MYNLLFKICFHTLHRVLRMFKDNTNGSITSFPQLLLFVDGGCEPKNPGGVATSGWVIFDSKNLTKPLVEHAAVVRDGGSLATNNYGEYKSLCLALKWLSENKWRGELTVKADSKLLVEQVSGRWKVNAPHLKSLRQKIWDYLTEIKLSIVDATNPLPADDFNPCHLIWVQRNLNEHANNLCRQAYQEYKNGKTNITELLESVQSWV